MLRELFATSPSEFVAARNELVKSLRRDKRRDEATALAALRRPGWDDWALNAVAREHADTVSAFAAAAGSVRQAQAAAIEGRGGPDVRAALRELRNRSAELVRLGGEALERVGREQAGGELTARLSEIAVSGTAVEQLRAAVLGSGDAAEDDLFAGLQPAKRPAGRPAKRPPRETPPPVTPSPEAPVRMSAAERRRRVTAREEARREHRAAMKAMARADADVDAAQSALERADRELADARRRRDEAADAVASAETALAQAEADAADAS